MVDRARFVGSLNRTENIKHMRCASMNYISDKLGRHIDRGQHKVTHKECRKTHPFGCDGHRRSVETKQDLSLPTSKKKKAK